MLEMSFHLAVLMAQLSFKLLRDLFDGWAANYPWLFCVLQASIVSSLHEAFSIFRNWNWALFKI